FKDLSHWAKSTSAPFDLSLSRGRAEQTLQKAWSAARKQRIPLSSPQHPFRLAGGGKQTTYKLFTELFWTLLREDGRIGAVVPTGLYSDLSTRTLREEL